MNLIFINPFVPNIPFLYPLKISENHKVFWCFQGIQKGCIGNKWVKSCFAFLSKVYIKYSRILDTLPTPKMEFFVTIGICKVICSRLMILYTQYCSVGVFICVSSLQVLFCYREFHGQASETVLFVTMTIANVVFYWLMALNVQFLAMNFLFFCASPLLSPSRYRCFQVVPARSK